MRVLVTGAAGFAGRYLVDELLSAGHEVFGSRVDSAPHDDAGRIRWVEMDLASPASVEEAVRVASPEGVFHLAAQSSVGHSFRDPLGTWDVNSTGTVRLVHELRKLARPVRLFFASSAEVYGPVPEEEQPIPESAPVQPRSMYAAAKAAAEIALQQAGTEGWLDSRIARSFNHTGPGQSPIFALPDFARQIRSATSDAEPLSLRVGDLSVRRDFLDVRDVVRAYRRIFEVGEPGEIYNVASGHPRSLRELVDVLIEVSGRSVEVVPESARMRAIDIPLLAGSAEKLHTLGWTPAVPIERTLRDLYASVEEG